VLRAASLCTEFEESFSLFFSFFLNLLLLLILSSSRSVDTFSREFLIGNYTRNYKKRCFALRLYVDTLNKELPRSVGKITLPEPPYGKVEAPSVAVAQEDEEEAE